MLEGLGRAEKLGGGAPNPPRGEVGESRRRPVALVGWAAAGPGRLSFFLAAAPRFGALAGVGGSLHGRRNHGAVMKAGFLFFEELAVGPDPTHAQIGGSGDEQGPQCHLGAAHHPNRGTAQRLFGLRFHVREGRLGIGAAPHRVVVGVRTERMLLIQPTHITHRSAVGVGMIEVHGDGRLLADVALGAGSGNLGGDDDPLRGGDPQRVGFQWAGDPPGGGGALVTDGAVGVRARTETAEGVALPLGNQLLVTVDSFDRRADRRRLEVAELCGQAGGEEATVDDDGAANGRDAGALTG